VLLILVGAIVYANTFEVPFYFEDNDIIGGNPHIRLTALSAGGLADAAFGSLSSGSPLPNLSFALNYYFHGYDVTGYHLVNSAIHGATAILLFFLFSYTLTSPSLRQRVHYPTLIAAAGALLWLVHPLHTQSVTYIVQRISSMAALFSVLCFTLYARARLASADRKWMLFAAAAVAWVLALGSKPIAATVPLFILLYEWFFFQNLSWEWLRTHKRWLIAAVALSAAAAGIFLALYPKGAAVDLSAFKDVTLSEWALTQLRVIVFYLSLVVYPNPGRLSLEHDFPFSHSLIDPPITLFALAAVIGILGFALWRARKEPLLSFSLFWFFGNVLIASSIMPQELVFEHRTYVPSVFLALTAAALVYRIIGRPWFASAVLAGIIFLFGSWTLERNSVWKSPVVFWTDCVQKAPLKARAQTNLGVVLYQQGKTKEAEEHLTEAIRLDPKHARAFNNRGDAYNAKGEYDRALADYGSAI